jgi:hypothetical protein
VIRINLLMISIYRYFSKTIVNDGNKLTETSVTLSEAKDLCKSYGYLEKLEFSFKIKACEKFNRGYMSDISRIKFFA